MSNNSHTGNRTPILRQFTENDLRPVSNLPRSDVNRFLPWFPCKAG
jgi:hypothetical protein